MTVGTAACTASAFSPGRSAWWATLPPYFCSSLTKRSLSIVPSLTSPILRVWSFTSSPPNSAFLPTSCLPSTSAELIAVALLSALPHQYGDAFAESA